MTENVVPIIPRRRAALLKLHEQLCEQAINIMKVKNQDYSGGVDDPFANFR